MLVCVCLFFLSFVLSFIYLSVCPYGCYLVILFAFPPLLLSTPENKRSGTSKGLWDCGIVISEGAIEISKIQKAVSYEA